MQTFLEDSENSLPTVTDLFNEIRGVGAVMFLGGLIALLGVVRTNFQLTSFTVVTVIFGGVILGRLLSFLVDGIPSQNLISVSLIEGILAGLNVFCLINTLIQIPKL